MPSVTYIGTPDDATDVITHGGVTFEKGKAKTVTAAQMKAGNFDTNQTFKVKADKADDDDGTVDASADADGLDAFTVADLKAHAIAEGVDLGEATKKADILAAIRSAKA